MIKRALMAGAFAGLLTLVGAGASSALPLAKSDASGAGVTLVGHPHGIGGGFQHRGGGFGGFRSHGGIGPGRGYAFYGNRYRGYPGRRYGRGFGYGYGFPYYAYYGSYGYGYGGCGWLKIRAIETGSPYWWQRYEACRYGY